MVAALMRFALFVRSQQLCLISALCVTSAVGRAQKSPPDIALAESLFLEGRRLMAEGKYDKACPKLAESQRLDPAVGTLLNVGACYEAQGRTASAWAVFREALGLARGHAVSDRVLYAEQRINELEPKLVRLNIVVPAEAEAEKLRIEINGAELSAVARGVPRPVDPGAHRVRVDAPGRRSWSTQIHVTAKTGDQTVTIPVLEKLPEAPRSTAPAPPSAPIVETTTLAPDSEKAESFFSPRLVVGSLAGLCAAGAVVTGFLYISKQRDYDDANFRYATAAQSLRDEATTFGIMNLVFAGGAIITGTTYFFLPQESSPAKPSRTSQSKPRALQFRQAVSANGVMLSLRGEL